MPERNVRLPPLDLLLTFEAAARLLSFTRAAEERFVTQSAVSRQIRALEDDLKVTLFRRGHRALELTGEGQVLFASCRQALRLLRDTVGRLREPVARRVLTVTTTPGLASLWLIPRLTRFTRRHAGIDVRIDATFERRDLVRDDIDVAVRYEATESAEGIKLFDESVMPVCSPALLAPDSGAPPLRRVADLAQHTLLRIDQATAASIGLPQEWRTWLAAMGEPDLEPRAMVTFSNYDEEISAAVHGQGVALGRRPLIDRFLQDGRLVAPFEGAMSSPRAYFVVVNPLTATRPETQALATWLLEEARMTRDPDGPSA